jgi:hypothetical protein
MSRKKVDSLTVDISDFEDVDVDSFTIRKMTGKDAIKAVERAVNPKADRQVNALVNLYSRSNQIADAITHINGAAVVTPFVEWEDYGTRTQFFIERAYDKLNSVNNEESERFLGRLGPKPDPTQPDSAPHT